MNDSFSDEEVWNYAKENNLTIISKDADFSNRMMVEIPPPRIVHLRIGNMKLNAMHTLLNRIWKDIELMSEKNKLVIVFEDSIEGIE